MTNAYKKATQPKFSRPIPVRVCGYNITFYDVDLESVKDRARENFDWLHANRDKIGTLRGFILEAIEEKIAKHKSENK